ncbi:MAG: hypothetical protein IJC34_08120 [Lentisphaeria bacterium]|nr:hypothetical protein [Lentisphaeria bacterium]
MKECLTLLNIAPLLPGHEAEVAGDILRMYETGVITENAFIMSLVPEGDPPADKGRILGDLFLSHRAALGKTEMPVGILLQSTMGHGWVPSARSGFQTLIEGNGNKPYIFCPLDEGFQEYIYNTVAALAKLKPDFFMLDDDTRLITGRNGCFCPLHVAQFNRENGTSYDGISLPKAINEDRGLAAAYDDLLKRSVLQHARTIRRAIDSVDPDLHCSFCLCAHDVRHAPEMAAVLAAPGKPVTIRINHGLYLHDSLRDLPGWLWITECQLHVLGPEVRVFSEPDTCPHNNYSTSAAMLHFHMVNSMLSGCKGGKMWLSRTAVPEPASGMRYRRKLAENRGFYETAAKLSPAWGGVTGLVPGRDFLNFPMQELGKPVPGSVRQPKHEVRDLNWNVKVFGRMGYPVRFASASELHDGDVVALTGSDCAFLSDAELAAVFARCHVLLDGAAAETVVSRGFTAETGLTGAEEIRGKSVALETFPDGRYIAGQNRMFHLIASDACEELSQLWHKDFRYSPEKSYIGPGAVRFINAAGHTVISTACSVQEQGHGAFGMMNETRKAVLREWLDDLSPLRWFIPGDDEVLFRYGTADGADILAVTDLSLDDMPQISLAGQAAATVEKVEFLQPDGSWKPCRFDRVEDGVTIHLCCRPLHTQILRVRRG